MFTGLLLLVTAAAISGSLYYLQGELRTRDVEETLQPIAALLKDDRRILADLDRQGAGNSDAVLLENYLVQVRKDGVPQHSGLKLQIDQLVTNNVAIVTLLDRYSARARTSAFKAGALRFRRYATTFHDRWQSIFEIFMAGGICR
jgi:hypothetical protein